MSGPPEAMQHPAELAELLELYAERQPRRVLEIGTGDGGTLYHWLGSAADRAVIVAVDDRHVAVDRYEDWRPYDVTLISLLGRSADPVIVALVAEHAPYDWIYIDADHHYAAVQADWRLYAPLADPAGVIVLHDVAPTDDPKIEVDTFWRELKAHFTTARTREIVAADGGYGIGIVFGPDAGSDVVSSKSAGNAAVF